VADEFHLVQNIHKTVKDALYQEVPHDLFVREGEGWIRMTDSAGEDAADALIVDDSDCLIVIGPAILAKDDLERRIHLAGLTNRQADKYRKTMQILELTESGLRTSEIAKRLSLKVQDICNYRKNAPETIKKVEDKIDEYYHLHEKQPWGCHQKTITKNARPSSESIVEPYKETVLRMLGEGKNHRNIYPVIKEEGFEGSANAVYQYIIKYARENCIPYGRNARVIPPQERTDDETPPRPPPDFH
jgi:DNA-binding CsgD family transcriptional regulator